MIELKTLAENLQNKLNNNTLGLTFRVVPDTGTRKKPFRVRNTVTDVINGVLSVISSDLTNLVDETVVATISCRLRLIVRLKGGVSDEDETIVNPENNTVAQVIEGNITVLERIRDYLSNVFSTNEQGVMTEDGKDYIVSTIYNFAESGERDQVEGLGDSFTFSAYIAYMFVENGINTYDIKYYLDGKQIPFQLSTLFRNPTMDGNVYSDSPNGAVKNLSSQSVFEASFTLPALQNSVTRAMFKWLFSGELNTAHILSVVPSIPNEEEKNYLVTFGQVSLKGETIKNQGQEIPLVEIADDYELVKIPDNMYIYEPITNNYINKYPLLIQCQKITINTQVGNTQYYTSTWRIGNIFDKDYNLIAGDFLSIGDIVYVRNNNEHNAEVIDKGNNPLSVIIKYTQQSDFYSTNTNEHLIFYYDFPCVEFASDSSFYVFNKRYSGYGKSALFGDVGTNDILITSAALTTKMTMYNWQLVRSGNNNG